MKCCQSVLPIVKPARSLSSAKICLTLAQIPDAHVLGASQMLEDGFACGFSVGDFLCQTFFNQGCPYFWQRGKLKPHKLQHLCFLSLFSSIFA
jgi:hypothetical protein